VSETPTPSSAAASWGAPAAPAPVCILQHLRGGLTTGAAPPPPFPSPLAALRTTMMELTTPRRVVVVRVVHRHHLEPARPTSSGSTTGYRNPHAPCALRTTSAAPGSMCRQRCSTTLALSSIDRHAYESARLGFSCLNAQGTSCECRGVSPRRLIVLANCGAANTVASTGGFASAGNSFISRRWKSLVYQLKICEQSCCFVDPMFV
jgi:hypothetical protein